MEPDRFEQFAKAFVSETNRQRSSVAAAKAGKQAALDRVERQIKRLVDAIVDGADAMPLNAKLKELDAERTRMLSEVEFAPDEQPLLHPALAVTYRDRVAALATALNNEKDGRQAFERLRSVVEEVCLTPVDGQLTIELKGTLAEILKIGSTGAQLADTAQKNSLQIKLVAGACKLHKLLFRSQRAASDMKWSFIVGSIESDRYRPNVGFAERQCVNATAFGSFSTKHDMIPAY